MRGRCRMQYWEIDQALIESNKIRIIYWINKRRVFPSTPCRSWTVLHHFVSSWLEGYTTLCMLHARLVVCVSFRKRVSLGRRSLRRTAVKVSRRRYTHRMNRTTRQEEMEHRLTPSLVTVTRHSRRKLSEVKDTQWVKEETDEDTDKESQQHEMLTCLSWRHLLLVHVLHSVSWLSKSVSSFSCEATNFLDNVFAQRHESRIRVKGYICTLGKGELRLKKKTSSDEKTRLWTEKRWTRTLPSLTLVLTFLSLFFFLLLSVSPPKSVWCLR